VSKNVCIPDILLNIAQPQSTGRSSVWETFMELMLPALQSALNWVYGAEILATARRPNSQAVGECNAQSPGSNQS